MRLKKARVCLADARRALDAIEAGRLIPLSRCQDLLRELALARDEVDRYIVEVRQILADD